MLIIKSIKQRFEEKHQIEVLQKEKINTELQFLKAQIHPHFLFNTLNNLYALTLSKSDDAPKVVLKLSEMLDYILYQCNEPKVALKKEIELLNNYIDLEKLRYGKLLKLTFNADIDNENTQIASLILLTFVENAFKHGASNNPINPEINIDLGIINEQLNFKIFNTKPSNYINSDKKGIGFNNVKRQLEINYPNKYSLDIEDKKESYSVYLKIELN